MDRLKGAGKKARGAVFGSSVISCECARRFDRLRADVGHYKKVHH